MHLHSHFTHSFSSSLVFPLLPSPSFFFLLHKPIRMYPSPHRPTGQGGLTRYSSAPSNLLTTAVNSVVGGGADQDISAVASDAQMGRYFSCDSSSFTSESSCKVNVSPDLKEAYRNERVGTSSTGLQRSYGLNEIAVGDFATDSTLRGGAPPSLIRHSSSPAGFFNHLMVDNGFSITKGIGSYNSHASTNGGQGIANGRLKSQLSFTRQDSLSQISEVSENGIGGCSSDDGPGKVGHFYGSNSFPMGSWDDTNAIVFSAPSNKRAKIVDDDIIAGLSGIDSEFSLPRTSLEMSTVENLLQMHQDAVPCKTRAKRGCATHPRSIAERERRTRISAKLKKLQDLVPNMDKQTNTADMLDLAVQHIKILQSQVQKLNKDLESCTCGCKQET